MICEHSEQYYVIIINGTVMSHEGNEGIELCMQDVTDAISVPVLMHMNNWGAWKQA